MWPLSFACRHACRASSSFPCFSLHGDLGNFGVRRFVRPAFSRAASTEREEKGARARDDREREREDFIDKTRRKPLRYILAAKTFLYYLGASCCNLRLACLGRGWFVMAAVSSHARDTAFVSRRCAWRCSGHRRRRPLLSLGGPHATPCRLRAAHAGRPLSKSISRAPLCLPPQGGAAPLGPLLNLRAVAARDALLLQHSTAEKRAAATDHHSGRLLLLRAR